MIKGCYMSDVIQPAVSRHGGVMVVSFGPDSESIYENQISGFRDPLLEQIKAEPPQAVVVELSHTRYFGSAFLAFMNHLRKTLQEQNQDARMGICSLTAYGKTVIKMAQLNQIWEVFDSLEAALDALTEKTE